ncbi:hypothetical protein QJQ45_014729 [Haematococcus lacustris]|nr:hypothetical protein QJQ45_014729 [Haematococcus lacustris]
MAERLATGRAPWSRTAGSIAEQAQARQPSPNSTVINKHMSSPVLALHDIEQRLQEVQEEHAREKQDWQQQQQHWQQRQQDWHQQQQLLEIQLYDPLQRADLHEYIIAMSVNDLAQLEEELNVAQAHTQHRLWLPSNNEQQKIKAREVTAQRRAAEAAGPIEIGAQAGAAIAAEAQAQADVGADEADAQLPQLQADLQHREQQLAHNQRMQQLQQQLQDLQRSELQRKEQQLADLVAQQRAALLQWEHQLTERQHQLQHQQVDLSRREQDLTERQHQLQQQQADLNSMEQQQARIHTLAPQLHNLQQELKAQQVAEVQREALTSCSSSRQTC